MKELTPTEQQWLLMLSISERRVRLADVNRLLKREKPLVKLCQINPLQNDKKGARTEVTYRASLTQEGARVAEQLWDQLSLDEERHYRCLYAPIDWRWGAGCMMRELEQGIMQERKVG